MTSFKDRMPQLSRRGRLGIGAAVLLAVGAAGGAGAAAFTRPAIEMAPVVATAIAKLPASSGIVTVKGRVAEVFGDRFVVQDQTGRTMIDAGRHSDVSPALGQAIAVQGRYDDGQLHASYLVGPDGRVSAVGPAGGPPRGPGGAERPRRDGLPTAGVPDRPGGAPSPAACGHGDAPNAPPPVAAEPGAAPGKDPAE